MNSNAQSPTMAESALIKAHRDRMLAQIQEAKARLDLLLAIAHQKKAHVEIAAIASLMKARQDIDLRIRDFATTHASNLSRAKIEIAADVAKLRVSVDELAARLKSRTVGK